MTVVTPEAPPAGKAPPASNGSRDVFTTQLLNFESDVRRIRHAKELHLHLCNASRKFLPFRQAFLCQYKAGGKKPRIVATSSVAGIDRNAPFIRWIEKICEQLSTATQSEQERFTLPAYCDPEDPEVDTYPFTQFLWTPLFYDGTPIGGWLTVREQPWGDFDCAMATRLTELYTHAWRALPSDRLQIKQSINKNIVLPALAILAVAIGVVPVPITALAPVEVTAAQPFIIAAPFDGVVKEILVDQGSEVQKNTPLLQFEDITLRNESIVARQRELVALTRWQTARQSAIADASAKRELEIARAEFEVAQAESNFALNMLEQTQVAAPRSGLVIYSDKRDWTGRPVAAGEAIMSIADPQEIRYSVDLPVRESIVLNDQARVKIFLDSDPLNPLEARLISSGYQSRVDKRNVLSYAIVAVPEGTPSKLPRIGTRGTAQLFGDKAALAYVLLRRPITYLRQLTGW